MAVIETEQEKQFRRELEQAVRDDLNFRRGISTGDATKLQFVMRWLREKEREREARAGQSDWYVRWTFWVVVVTLGVAFAGVIATVFHL
jgi:CHASE3 domain sensor protein